MIVKAECFEMRPKDRDYNKHGKKREAQVEVCGGGISYCLRTEFVYGLIIWETQNEDVGKTHD